MVRTLLKPLALPAFIRGKCSETIRTGVAEKHSGLRKVAMLSLVFAGVVTALLSCKNTQ